jgi:hypothetical protein
MNKISKQHKDFMIKDAVDFYKEKTNSTKKEYECGLINENIFKRNLNILERDEKEKISEIHSWENYEDIKQINFYEYLTMYEFSDEDFLFLNIKYIIDNNMSAAVLDNNHVSDKIKKIIRARLN